MRMSQLNAADRRPTHPAPAFATHRLSLTTLTLTFFYHHHRKTSLS